MGDAKNPRLKRAVHVQGTLKKQAWLENSERHSDTDEGEELGQGQNHDHSVHANTKESQVHVICH